MNLSTAEFIEHWLDENIHPEAFGAEACPTVIADYVAALIAAAADTDLCLLDQIKPADIAEHVGYRLRVATEAEVSRLIRSA